MTPAKMTCSIYKGSKKADIYLYVPARNAFDLVPKALLMQLGQLVHVMDLELTPERKLAREDTRKVMQNLAEVGYHVQLPPKDQEDRLH